LKKSAADYLVIQSQPPTAVRPGEKYTYWVTAKSKKGGLRYRLNEKPDGMTLSPDGKITWAVPADFTRRETNVVVAVSDDAGREVLHPFTIALRTGKPIDLVQAPPRPGDPAKGPALEAEVRALPATVGDVAAGGGGRYLVMSLPRLRKLAVFDVQEDKVAHYI